MGRPLLVPAWFRDVLEKAAQQLSLFDEQAHPRHGKGSPKGGQFAPKGGAKQGGAKAEARPPRRKRSHGDTESALAAAVHNARLDGTTKYVYGVYRGSFGGVEGVFDEPPPFKKQHYRVTPDGKVELVKPEYDNTPKGIADPDEAREYILRTLAEKPEGMDPYDLGKPVDQATWEDVYQPMFDDGTLEYDEDSETVRLRQSEAPASPAPAGKPEGGAKLGDVVSQERHENLTGCHKKRFWPYTYISRNRPFWGGFSSQLEEALPEGAAFALLPDVDLPEGAKGALVTSEPLEQTFADNVQLTLQREAQDASAFADSSVARLTVGQKVRIAGEDLTVEKVDLSGDKPRALLRDKSNYPVDIDDDLLEQYGEKIEPAGEQPLRKSRRTVVAFVGGGTRG